MKCCNHRVMIRVRANFVEKTSVPKRMLRKMPMTAILTHLLQARKMTSIRDVCVSPKACGVGEDSIRHDTGNEGWPGSLCKSNEALCLFPDLMQPSDFSFL